MIRILLADDHGLVRAGMKQLISFSRDIRVTAEAASGKEVLQKLLPGEFDLLVLDFTMPGIGGAQLIAEICRSAEHPPILVLTMHGEPHIAKIALESGARGFVTKDCPPDVLETAIRKVAAGRHYLQHDIAEKMLFEAPAEQGPRVRLSPQETRILKLLANGMRSVDIAGELGLSSQTVSTYKMRLMRKLDIDNDRDLIRYADASGLK